MKASKPVDPSSNVHRWIRETVKHYLRIDLNSLIRYIFGISEQLKPRKTKILQILQTKRPTSYHIISNERVISYQSCIQSDVRRVRHIISNKRVMFTFHLSYCALPPAQQVSRVLCGWFFWQLPILSYKKTSIESNLRSLLLKLYDQIPVQDCSLKTRILSHHFFRYFFDDIFWIQRFTIIHPICSEVAKS